MLERCQKIQHRSPGLAAWEHAARQTTPKCHFFRVAHLMVQKHFPHQIAGKCSRKQHPTSAPPKWRLSGRCPNLRRNHYSTSRLLQGKMSTPAEKEDTTRMGRSRMSVQHWQRSLDKASYQNMGALIGRRLLTFVSQNPAGFRVPATLCTKKRDMAVAYYPAARGYVFLDAAAVVVLRTLFPGVHDRLWLSGYQ